MTPKPKLAWQQAGAALALALSANIALAVDDYVIGSFDTDIAVVDGSYGEWPAGSSTKTLEWSSEDAGGDSASGSAKAIINFTGSASGWNDSKLVFHDATGSDFAWPGIDTRKYVNLEWDIKVDMTNSFPAGDGAYGMVQVVCQGWEGANGNPANLGWVVLGNTFAITNLGGWQHMKQSLVDYPYNLNKLVLSIAVTSGTNTMTYLVDNVKLTAPPQPPPSLSMEKAVPGLAFIAASGGQWDRQNIRTVGTDYNWIGRSGPVTYSVHVAKHAAVDGFRLHMYLVPGISNPGRADSDWHETNLLMVAISSNPNGGAWATVNAKHDAPESNGQLFTPAAEGGGDLGGVGAANAKGTWTLTISQDTNIVLTAPGGGSLSNTIPPAFINAWKQLPEMQFAVGVMPGNVNYVGQKATVKGIKVTGAAGPNIDATFPTTALDTNIWSVVASSPANGVQQIPNDAAYWVNWTLPANGYRLQGTPTLSPAAWATVPVSGFSAGTMRYNLIRQANLPGANAGFFRLTQPGYSKLLLLLPGETAAPGTPTGKTGTPTAQQLNVPFDFTVRAVDSEWFPVSEVDNAIRITSTDANMVVNWTALPYDATLSSGSWAPPAASSLFGTQGTWTIKVEDVTDPTKTAYTSAPVTVAP